MMQGAEDERLSEAALIAATGISPRNLIRWRQQGLIPVIESRRGRGRGRGTTPLEYPLSAVATIRRLLELQRQFKNVAEWRWRLWLERYPVRIAPDLADTLARFRALTKQIETLSDIETKIPANLWKPSNLPRGHLLRVIFRDLNDYELHSLTTLIICFLLGIRLPLFDEPNPYSFQVFKRAFGLPKEWQLPPGLFDVFRYASGQIHRALVTASADELEVAIAACRLLSRILETPGNWRRGAINITGVPLPWRPIKLLGLMWPSPVVRAATVGLVIFRVRAFRSALGDEAFDAFASIASEAFIRFPDAS